jgi:DNA polymerase I-like protein with 3'-5' exonuclease and polymerase domains
LEPNSASSQRGPSAPAVLSLDEISTIVDTVKAEGAFSFDVETRGHIDRHPDIMAIVEEEWNAKQASLKSDHPTVVQKSRQAIEDKWRGNLALDTLRNEVFWIGIATRGKSWAIPMGHPNGEVLVKEQRGDGSTIPPEGHRAILASGKESMARAKYFIPATFTDPPEQLTQEQVFTALEPLFMDEGIVKINQNIKFDAKSIAKYYGGTLPKGRYIDTMVLMHIADENLTSYRLSSIIDRVFSFDPYHRDGKIGKTITTEPFSKACRYVHYDVRWAWLAYKRLMRYISNHEGLLRAMYLDSDALSVLAQMEMNGIAVNQREIKKLGKSLDLDINNKMADIAYYAPIGFNPDSNAHKVEFLFNKKREGGLGLKPKKTTAKGNPSVDEDSLKSLQGQHPIIDYLMEYAELKKMKSTYVDGLIPMMNKGRLHPQFHLSRTATGRLSSSDPNLQNIPRDKRVRGLFIAEPGDSLIVADYSQIEMRIMAMYSQDPALLHIFAENIDVHAGTASVILGKPPEEISSEERNIYGKTPNFLMGYGGGPKRLVDATGGQLSLDEARTVVENYNSGYAGLTAWKHKAIADGRRRGYVETMTGRRRRVSDLSSDDFAAKSRAERQVINAIIQGTAAEICKEAMVKLSSALEYPKCKMLVQVHDEIVISAPADELNTWEPLVEDCMGNGRVIMGVSLEVEAHHAGSWSEAKG